MNLWKKEIINKGMNKLIEHLVNKFEFNRMGSFTLP